MSLECAEIERKYGVLGAEKKGVSSVWNDTDCSHWRVAFQLTFNQECLLD